jgi:hypothetical protein
MTFSTGTNSSSGRVEWNEVVVLLLTVLSEYFNFLILDQGCYYEDHSTTGTERTTA